MSALKDTYTRQKHWNSIYFEIWRFVNIQCLRILYKTVSFLFFFILYIFCVCFSHWTCWWFFFCCSHPFAFHVRLLHRISTILGIWITKRVTYNNERKKKYAYNNDWIKTAAAASSFEPDFVFPLENVSSLLSSVENTITLFFCLYTFYILGNSCTRTWRFVFK